MEKNKKSGIGLKPIKIEKQRIEHGGLERAARYNYYDMYNSTSLIQSFTRKLPELRIQKGVSAREMSLSLGQSPSYINDIENKRALPSMAMFFEICEYLNTKPSEFFSYKKDSKALVPTEFFEHFDKLGNEDKVLLLKIAELLFEQRGKENG